MTMMMTARMSRFSLAIIAAMIAASACGGGSDDSSSESTTPVTEAVVEDSTPDSVVTTPDSTSDSTSENDATSPEATDSPAGSADDYEPGGVGFRVVNLLDESVDIYVRTSGLVEAFTIAEGVEPGGVTDLVAPPTDGAFVVTEAGAGDATCVVDCDHFITDLTAFDDHGPVHTVILYNHEDYGRSTFDLWEQPLPDDMDSSNAMAPADATSGVVVVTADALSDAQFGLQLAIAGSPGCLSPFNLENVLVGGSQTPAFTYTGDTVELVLHDSGDRDCVEEPVGGPFTVDGGAGTRSHLILTGSPGTMDAVTLPMLDDAVGG